MRVQPRLWLSHTVASVLIMASCTCMAEELTSYPIVWFSNSEPSVIKSDGVNTVRLGANWSYLIEAYQEGVNVIRVIGTDVEKIQRIVNNLKGYPALVGWYTTGEPDEKGQSVEECEAAYNAIKDLDDKPVFLNIDADKPDVQNEYKNAYDVMIPHDYQLHAGDEEFEGMESPFFPFINGFKTWMKWSRDTAWQNGKGFYPVIQAFGNAVGAYRLPTKAELRFMTHYCIQLEADGLAYSRRENAVASTAQPGEPYPFDGQQWIDEVFRPVIEEINIYGDAVDAGKIPGGVSDNKRYIVSKLYQDPNTQEYYILSLNEKWWNHANVRMTIQAGVDFSEAIPVEGGDPIPIVDNQFYDAFVGYEVHAYRLVESP